MMGLLKWLGGAVEVTTGGEPTKVGTCLLCGCMVPDVRLEIHQNWHNSLAAAQSVKEDGQ